jgi:general nucleoside transport system permease protein
MENLDLVVTVLMGSLIFSTPIIITALGGLICEKSGIVNIGLEGMMTFGAFLGATCAALVDPVLPSAIVLPVSLLVGAIGGGLFGLLHAYLSISVRADQIISGTAVNMMTLALAGYLTKVIFGSGQTARYAADPVVFGDNLYFITVLTIVFAFII